APLLLLRSPAIGPPPPLPTRFRVARPASRFSQPHRCRMSSEPTWSDRNRQPTLHARHVDSKKAGQNPAFSRIKRLQFRQLAGSAGLSPSAGASAWLSAGALSAGDGPTASAGWAASAGCPPPEASPSLAAASAAVASGNGFGSSESVRR